MEFDQQKELQLLEAIEAQPDTTQADLATQVGVAVGTVNWYLKRWSAKGFVIVKRMGRWRWRYLLTPQGMAEKARLTGKYLEASMIIYRRTRDEAKTLLGEVQAAGYDSVRINGQGDIADICRLTCLELGLEAQTAPADHLPTIQVEGMALSLVWPGEDGTE